MFGGVLGMKIRAEGVALDMEMWIEDDERSWESEAACRGMDSELFFPPADADVSEALAVCRVCPVRQECLEWALSTHERYGIWGGTTGQERRRIMRRSA